MLRRSTAPKSASAFASSIGRHLLRIGLDTNTAKDETIVVVSREESYSDAPGSTQSQSSPVDVSVQT